ncbi:MAG TPA: Panacea domain-containing protein [Planctomycetota bacterium]
MPGRDQKTIEVLATALSRLEGNLGRTKLIKLAYLSDYFARKTIGRPITSYTYRFGDHGPFDRAFYDTLEVLGGEGVQERRYEEWDAYRYTVPAPLAEARALDSTERHIVESVIEKFGRLPLRQLLDFVYSTEPMISAEPGAELRMDVVNGSIARETGLDFDTYLASRAALREGDRIPIEDLIDAL